MNEPSRHEDQPFGLPPLTIDNMRRFLAGWPEIEKIVIFGSRATGNWRYNSDIDICIWGKDIDYDLLGRIKSGFADLPTPYKYDVVHYDKIDHQPLKDHIDAVGKDFWEALKMGGG
ncbi:MAG: nucleotidyltransferase domain-containing protein [Alphaproteobacteria bacterium]